MIKRFFATSLGLIGRYGHYLAWTIALLSMLLSLYLSDVLHFLPCVLCWWTRILMYPLVAVIGVGILRREWQWVYYVLPLTLVGNALTAYHSLLQWGIIPEALAPCTNGIPCTTKYLDFFGFVTIPFLGLLAFTGINVCLYLYWKENKRVA